MDQANATASLHVEFEPGETARAAREAEDLINRRSGLGTGGPAGGSAPDMRQLVSSVADLVKEMREGRRTDGGGRDRSPRGGSTSRGAAGGARGGGMTPQDKEEAAKDRWSERWGREQMKGLTPADRLGIIKEEYAHADEGSVTRARLRYEMAAEQNRVDKAAERQAARDRKAAERAAAKAAPFKTADDPDADPSPWELDKSMVAGDESLSSRPWEKQAKLTLKQRKPPPLPGAEEKGGATGGGGLSGLIQQAMGGRGGVLGNLAGMLGGRGAGGVASLLGGASGGSSALGGLMGSIGGGAAGGVAGLAGGPIGAAVKLTLDNMKAAGGMMAQGAGQAGRAMLTGDASSFLKGGIGVVGGNLSGAAGPLLGGMIRKVTEALQGLVDGLDNVVADLSKYSGAATTAMATYDVEVLKFKMAMSESTEGLQVSWLELKKSVLELMTELKPVLQVAIDGLKLLVDAIKGVVDFVKGAVSFAKGGASNASKLLPGVGLLTNPAGFFGLGGSSESSDSGDVPAVADGSGGGMSEFLSRALGRAMVGDMRPGTGEVPGLPSGMSPTAYEGYRAPDGGGIGFNSQQSFAFNLQDQEAAERAMEQVRQRLAMQWVQQADRIEILAAHMDGRNAVALMG